MVLLLPEDCPLMNDLDFLKDREYSFASPDYKWDAQSRKEQRPTSFHKVADMFTLLEETLLAEGCTCILGTPQPSLADIEAGGSLNFILEIPSALPEA